MAMIDGDIDWDDTREVEMLRREVGPTGVALRKGEAKLKQVQGENQRLQNEIGKESSFAACGGGHESETYV